jgi:hypothetical protein
MRTSEGKMLSNGRLSCTGTSCVPGLVIAGDPYASGVLLDLIGWAIVEGAVVRAELPDLSVKQVVVVPAISLYMLRSIIPNDPYYAQDKGRYSGGFMPGVFIYRCGFQGPSGS